MFGRRTLQIALLAAGVCLVVVLVVMVASCFEIDFSGRNVNFGAPDPDETAAVLAVAEHGGVVNRFNNLSGPVKWVSFRSAPAFRDKDLHEVMSALTALTQLRALTLAGTGITDAGLKELVALKQLLRLDLAQTQIGDAGVKALSQISSLKKLNLEHTRITDDALTELARLTNLQELVLTDTPITAAGLKHLAGMKLKQLVIPQQAKTDLGLKNLLAALDAYTSLDLRDWHITEAGLAELSGLIQPLSLFLAGNQITDASLKQVAKLHELRQLALEGCPVTDAGLKELLALSSLNWLKLLGTQVTDTGLQQLAALKQLRTLELVNTRITAGGIAALEKALPKCSIQSFTPSP